MSKYFFGGNVTASVIGDGTYVTPLLSKMFVQTFGRNSPGIVIGNNTVGIGEGPRLDPVNITGLTVTVNKQPIVGNTISYSNGKMYVNGKEHPLEKSEELHITIVGNVNDGISTTSGKVHVKGNVKASVKTMSGPITVEGDVTGGASTMSGPINISGSLLSGNASSMSGPVRVNKTGTGSVPLKKKTKDTNEGFGGFDD